jgi:hypothetical protein
MPKTIAEAIAELQESIQAKDAEINAVKRRINVLCEADGQEPLYPEVPEPGVTTVQSRVIKIRPDEFAADKLMKAMRRYLEMRKLATPENAPAKPEEITKALISGGFDFKGKDANIAVGTSPGKSSHTFKRFDASGLFGLHVWYGGRPKRKSEVTAEQDEDDDDDAEPIPSNKANERDPEMEEAESSNG